MQHLYRKTLPLLLSTCLCSSAFAMEVGQMAPDFDLPGRTSAVKLSDYKGKTDS